MTSDGRAWGVKRVLGIVGALLIPFSPIAASALLILLRLTGKVNGLGRNAWAWIMIWLPSILLVLVMRGSKAPTLEEFSGPLILMLAGLLLPKLKPGQVAGLWIGAVILVGLLLTERYVAATTWHPSLQTAVSLERFQAARSAQRITGGNEPHWFERRWSAVPVDADLELELEVRHAGGPTERAWFESAPGFELEPLADRPLSTRVVPPNDGEPYLTRRVATGAPLEGRTFRASIEMRASKPLTFSAPDCRGVLLREVGGSGAAGCFAQEVSTDWERLAFEWTPPEGATSDLLRIELRVPADWYEVGAVLIEELTPTGWKALPPLEPTGLRVAFAPAGTAPLDWSGPTLRVSDVRTKTTVPVPPEAVSASVGLRVLLRAEPGTTIEVAGVTLRNSAGTVGNPVPLPQRGRLWFDHSNLAGHAVVAASIVVAALSVHPMGIAAATVVGVAGASITGSRTAFLALLVSCSLLLLLALARRRRRGVLVAGLTVAALAAVVITFGPLAERLDLTASGDGNQVGRGEIWSFAIQQLKADPWGVDRISFGEAWNLVHVNDPRPTPTHAHNLWLHYGAVYGIPGLILALALTVGLVLFANPRRRPAITVGVLGILTLQVTDYTLYFFPVALYLVLLVSYSGAGRDHDASTDYPHGTRGRRHASSGIG